MMIALSKRKKAMIAVAAILALLGMVALPYIGYAASSSTPEETLGQKTVIIKARGIGIQKIDNQTIKMPARMTLTCTPIKKYDGTIVFKITNGTVALNNTEYTIVEGEGLVIQPEHAVLLRGRGVAPDGQTATLKLRGRYFWMWGRLYVARLGGVLHSEETVLLLLRAAAKVP